MDFDEYKNKYSSQNFDKRYVIMSETEYLDNVYNKVLGYIIWENKWENEIIFQIDKDDKPIYIRFALSDNPEEILKELYEIL